jgi:putative membrane protein
MQRVLVVSLTALMIAALPAGSALAHGSDPLTPSTLWRAWAFDPLILMPLALVGVLYGRGYRVLWQRSQDGRGARRWHLAAFISGIAALVAALISPLHDLSEVLFSAHMVQHLLILLIAAPLLVLSAPLAPLWWSLPHTGRVFLVGIGRSKALRAVGNVLVNPVGAWVLHTTLVYVWHIPALFEAATQIGWLHALEHLSFLAAGWVYWWSLLTPRGVHPHGSQIESYSIGVLSLFATMMQSSLLGALMTFAPAAWYPIYADSTAAWGLSPLEDQQLAGLIMWLPAGTVYMGAAIGLGTAWFRAIEKRSLLHAKQKGSAYEPRT